MLTVHEALIALLVEVRPFAVETHPLAETHGLALAKDIVSNTDSPPFDKALMDGYAVRAADIMNGRATLTVIEEVTAGHVPQKPVGPGETTQIMTGAVIPDGADAVTPIEDSELEDGSAWSKTVKIATRQIESGTNIIHRGTSMKRGEQVLPAGRLLRPQELGTLAEMGQHMIAVRRQPRIGVLATGDELVPIFETPGPGQIRNSNETMLVAQIRRSGGEPVPLGIAHDERNHLRERILAGLECDVLLLCGGVSAGKLDLVPSELEAVGVRQVFHKVQVKPGKPIWFGVFEPSDTESAADFDRRCYVFGLPGNPVSSMVCFELFVRTAIRQLMGIEPSQPAPVRARLTKDHVARGNRPTYYPAYLDWNESGPVVTPVKWHGSSDLRATVEANAMVLFQAGDQIHQAGEIIEVFRWEVDTATYTN